MTAVNLFILSCHISTHLLPCDESFDKVLCGLGRILHLLIYLVTWFWLISEMLLS